jgi:hypothetical protein
VLPAEEDVLRRHPKLSLVLPAGAEDVDGFRRHAQEDLQDDVVRQECAGDSEEAAPTEMTTNTKGIDMPSCS